MLAYLKAKSVEYSQTLSWVDQELRGFDSDRFMHASLLERLQGVLEKARVNQTRLEAIVRIFGFARTELQREGLIKRAVIIIHDLELSTIILTHHYIPALRKEDAADLTVRRLLLSTAKQCGLDWIEDIAVRLDGAHGIGSYLTETPVLFAPPQQATSFFDMPGLYHELGHNVFRRFPNITEALHQLTANYFAEFRRNVGPITPDKKTERDRQIDRALAYWHSMRVDEVFCDIFGTFVCGPAHYVSCVDLAMRMDNELFGINLEDVHPPWGARVYACYDTLSEAQKKQPSVKSVNRAWNSYSSRQSRKAEFELVCPKSLLARIVESSIALIKQCLPEAKRYDDAIMQRSDGLEILPNDSLEIVLNKAICVLQTDPEHYESWEQEAFGNYMTRFSNNEGRTG